jgi:hypothetical protein
MVRDASIAGLLRAHVRGCGRVSGARLHDAAVDALLAETEYVEAFRRFRNATFHYQKKPFSPKLLEFLEAEGSEKWAQKLHAALKSFFETNLPIEEFTEELRKRNT